MMIKDTIEIKAGDSLRVEEFIEGICADNHLHNYFGSISVAVSTIMNMTSDSVVLGFEKCVGGVCFTVESETNDTFSILNQIADKEENESLFLISALTDELEVSEDAKRVDLIFYVNGIDEELASRRKELVREYSLKALRLVDNRQY